MTFYNSNMWRVNTFLATNFKSICYVLSHSWSICTSFFIFILWEKNAPLFPTEWITTVEKHETILIESHLINSIWMKDSKSIVNANQFCRHRSRCRRSFHDNFIICHKCLKRSSCFINERARQMNGTNVMHFDGWVRNGLTIYYISVNGGLKAKDFLKQTFFCTHRWNTKWKEKQKQKTNTKKEYHWIQLQMLLLAHRFLSNFNNQTTTNKT